MRFVRLYVALYAMGMAVFTLLADFNSPLWISIWAVWHNLAYGSVLGFGSLFYTLKGKNRELVRWMYYYSLFLLLWELSSFLTGLSINNEWAVAIAFGVIAVLVGYLSLWSDSKLSNLLSKRLLKN